MKRLFLFAFYDPQGIVGEAALRYLEALRGLGDIVLATDCDLQSGEADKLAPLVLSFTASRHKEYDFGSYKRAFLQADLSGYDVVYLVNDSVVGPVYPLESYLSQMEALGTDAFSLVLNPSRTVPYAGLYELQGKSVYNDVWRLSAKGFPFFKKSAFTRHGGSLGPSVRKVLAKADPAMASAIVADMDRLYGEDYRRKFLSASRIQAFGRYLSYLSRKVTGR